MVVIEIHTLAIVISSSSLEGSRSSCQRDLEQDEQRCASPTCTCWSRMEHGTRRQ